MDVGRLLIVLVADQSSFERWSHGRIPSWGAGATFPEQRLVLIRLDGGDPYQTLRHELAHVALHRAVAGRVPLWFDEGYAVIAAQEYGRLSSLRLNLAVALGRIPELDTLDAALRGSSVDAETAYALAGSAVADLAREAHGGTLASVLTPLRHGVPFDDAVLQGTGFSVDQFASVWQRWVRRQYNWLIWLETGGMWLVLSVALLWAAANRRDRDAARRAALDDGWPDPPVDDETITIQGFD